MAWPDAIANSIALFWMLVQQVCLCCIKWAHDDILGRGAGIKRYFAAHAAIFAFMLVLAFETLVGASFVYAHVPPGIRHFYPHLRWNFYFAFMMANDLLLLAYARRIYRLYMDDAPEAAPASVVRMQDAALAALAAAVYAAYHWGMTATVLKLHLPLWGIRRIQLFYTGVSDFFFPLIEGACAVMLWNVYKKATSGRVEA